MNYPFEAADMLNTPIECFYYDPENQPFPVTPHWHYFMEIIYIQEGAADIRSADKSYLLCGGDMILFHPRSVHGIYKADDKPLRYAVMKFDINCLSVTSYYIPKLRSIFRSAERRGMDVVFTAEFTESENIGLLFTDCINEYRQCGYGSDIIIRTHIYELLIKMIRHWQSMGFSVDSEVFAEDEQCDILNITELIDSGLSDRITVNEIAKRCKMSYSYFAKRFIEIYGCSCKEYIEQQRLHRVEELLLYTDFDLNYIAQETGYSDCSHMIKSFRKSKGTTPKQFRIQNTDRQ